MAARFPNASQFYLRAIASPVIPRIAAKFRAIPRNAAQFYAIQEQFREIPLNPAQRNPDWKSQMAEKGTGRVNNFLIFAFWGLIGLEL